jgi:FkbM family methyltransferase
LTIEDLPLYTRIYEKHLEELLVITNFFGPDPKKFLCIGAQDGLDHTHLLLKGGWSGIYCEPNPIVCSELITNTEVYKDKVTIINGAVMGKSGLQTFYLCKNITAISSFQESWTDHTMPDLLKKFPELPSEPEIQEILTNTISAQDLINHLGTDIDFISIDAEGSDPEIIMNMPWGILDKCKMAFIEYYN